MPARLTVGVCLALARAVRVVNFSRGGHVHFLFIAKARYIPIPAQYTDAAVQAGCGRANWVPGKSLQAVEHWRQREPVLLL
jgi:hypothetical protein